MRKVKKLIKCNKFNVAVIGDGKNPQLYFTEFDVYYPEDDFDSIELPIEAGTPADFIEYDGAGTILQMNLKTFKKIAKELLIK